MATKRAAGHRGRDIAPVVLGDFTKALAHLASEGKPLEELLKQAITEQGILKVLEVVARYNPKTLDAVVETPDLADAAIIDPAHWALIHQARAMLNAPPTVN
jgi:hypothetical protein